MRIVSLGILAAWIVVAVIVLPPPKEPPQSLAEVNHQTDLVLGWWKLLMMKIDRELAR